MVERKVSHLTDEQVSSFMQHGYLRVSNCFSRGAAAEWTSQVWPRLGMSPSDKSTWTRSRTNMPAHRTLKVSEFAPKAWEAICELVGGEERLSPQSEAWSDAFIVNLGSKEFEGVKVNPKELDGWHVDGDFFVHFLDSPEQALLVIPLWSDVEPGGGGTMVCTQGVGEVARFLYEHPEGVDPWMSAGRKNEKNLGFFKEIAKRCDDENFHEMTGNVGDVILLHPLMLHSATHNELRKERIITNPPVSLRAPFEFDREEGGYSLVELKTLRELGKERLEGWKIISERGRVVPEREKIQAKMKQDENRRLEAIKAKGLNGVSSPIPSQSLGV
jgi:hypothetical protein